MRFFSACASLCVHWDSAPIFSLQSSVSGYVPTAAAPLHRPTSLHCIHTFTHVTELTNLHPLCIIYTHAYIHNTVIPECSWGVWTQLSHTRAPSHKVSSVSSEFTLLTVICQCHSSKCTDLHSNTCRPRCPPHTDTRMQQTYCLYYPWSSTHRCAA